MYATSDAIAMMHYTTEVLLITSQYRTKPIPDISIQFNNSTIVPSDTARNLGVIFDNHFNFHQHISQTVKSGYYHLRNIKHILRYLPPNLCETLVHAFVTSRIDNCNSILANMNITQIHRIQKLQNSAARLLTGTSRRQHITPILMKLHWLPVQYRITYKILVTTYKCLHSIAPSYLSNTISLHKSTRITRQSNSTQLHVPIPKRVHFGERSFSYASPKLFNALPLSIRNSITLANFQASLKHHLFTLAYFH